MKTFSRLLVAVLITLGLAACSVDENPNKDSNKQTKESVYFQFKVDFPSTRSATTDDGQSTDGIEVGQDVENAVNKIMLVLSDDDAATGYTVYASATVPVTVTPTTEGDDVVYTIPLSTEQVAAFGDKKALVWVFCNPSSDLPNPVPAGYKIKDLKVSTDKSIWTDDNFLMSNQKLSDPVDIPKDLTPYNHVDNPFKLGTVSVERSAARFDLKIKEDGDDAKDFIFKIGNEFQIHFLEASLINMSNAFYAVHQVSDNGLTTGENFTVVGSEYSHNDKTNYIVDTDAGAKYDFSAEKPVPFTYPLSESDKWEHIAFPTEALEGQNYAKLFYCSENTIPQDNVGGDALQVNGLSTGIVFTARIEYCGDAADNGINDYGVDFKNADPESSEPELTAGIYVFNNILYGSREKLAEIAENPSTPEDASMAAAYALVLLDGGNQFKDENAVKRGFTVYYPGNVGGEKGYLVQYFYWNRHNDNGNPNLMGPMEFAVVRNNVYKLDITKVSKFGHPINPANDPDPAKPLTPDEPAKAYFEVTVHVLPWVLRVNNIEF